jgi:hypothetical protein
LSRPCRALRRIAPASDHRYDHPSLTRPQTHESRAVCPAVGSSSKPSVVRRIAYSPLPPPARLPAERPPIVPRFRPNANGPNGPTWTCA